MPGSIEKHMPGLIGLLAFDHVGRLVGRESDPVPDAVDEVLAVAGVGDHLASGAVDLLAGGAGRTASKPACCARRTISKTSRSSSVGSPTWTVLVVSEP